MKQTNFSDFPLIFCGIGPKSIETHFYQIGNFSEVSREYHQRWESR